jgi:hypothetical protein
MSTRKKTGRTRDNAREGETDWRRSLSAGALVVAVLGVLLVAALMQTRPEADSQVELPEPTHIEVGETGPDPLPAEAVDAPPGAEGTRKEVRIEPPPAADLSRGSDPLTRRTAADLRRLRKPGGVWTLQFASMCDPDRVTALLRSLETHERLYLVPAGDCYRIWWGRFATREAALSARGVPAELTGMGDSPFPRVIAESLP